MSQPLQKKPADGLDTLSAAQQAERLRLALLGSGVASFDWTMEDDRIFWDGAIDIIPYHADAARLARGASFQSWLNPESRARLNATVEGRNPQMLPFELALEAASALGSIWLTMVGMRYARHDGRAERLTGTVRVTTEGQREVQRLTYLATRDELTGHLNRNSLRAELTQAIDSAIGEDRHCAFLVASIDRLAMINDGYGFDAGDEVIVAAGERLARTLRSSDIIGRTAGNKFGVILRNCSEREIAIVAERLRAAIRSQVIDTRCGQVSATSSVGAVWLPAGASNSQEAMLRAEEALDRARRSGRDGFAVYEKSPQREGARLRLMQIADDVVAALDEGRLKLAYQPIIHARDRSVFKYECLLRMQRPDGTIATAGQFVPAAEQLGIVGLIDRRALEIAIDTLRRNPGVRLGVNVSGTAAGNPAWLASFIDYVRANLDVAGRLNIELTETAALHQFEENAQFVSQLRELGCTVAIDDFGAGYTSFRNLQTMHLDMVKIDGAYIKGLSSSPENQVFVRTLVGLAKNFNLKVVAEWVESEEDAQLLEAMGVDYFQGFFFGEPELEPEWLKV
ncbi:MAG: bifunctional diguanylate cyclase/phosphodiesterase [Proteobacteria bacterium]|nr:bifunctional diguanylate cyclase/phosphodiesterase [Pseudomonadota bacterium]